MGFHLGGGGGGAPFRVGKLHLGGEISVFPPVCIKH